MPEQIRKVIISDGDQELLFYCGMLLFQLDSKWLPSPKTERSCGKLFGMNGRMR